MTDAQQAFTESRSEAFGAGAGRDRMPLTQAAALIAAVSIALWCAIGFGVNWLLVG